MIYYVVLFMLIFPVSAFLVLVALEFIEDAEAWRKR